MPRFVDEIQGPGEGEVAERFSPAVVRADEAHAAADELAARVESAKGGILLREKGRLARKYGAESDPARGVDQALRDHEVGLAAAVAQAQRARIPVVPLDEKALRVHGRAVDANGAGIPRLDARLFVADEEKARARARTDEGGYFRLDAVIRGVERPAPRPARPAVPVEGPERPGEEPPAPEAPAGPALQLQLSHGDVEVHREEIRSLGPGQARYREIVVPPGR
jgi:hypothetical protein